MNKLFLFLFSLFIVYNLANAQQQITNYASQNSITCLAEDGTHIWVGSTGGIALRNKSNGSLIALYTTSNGLLNNNITDIALDAMNNLWAATIMGLQKFDGATWTYFTNENTSGGLSDNYVTSIKFDLQGNLWCGTFDKGISKFNGSNWISYNVTNSGLIDNHINDIAVDNYGNIWIATTNGASKFDGISWTSFTTSEGIYNNYIFKIFVDSDDIIWFGTEFSLSKYDGINFTNYYLVAICDINMDSYGNLWLAGYSGVYKYDGTNFINYNSINSNINNEVKSILIDNQGNKWFGCKDGLIKYDGINWNKYLINNTLAYNQVYDIITDNTGNTWFSTWGGGISKLAYTNVWTNYDTSNGLLDNRTYCIAIDGQGNKWFGTTNGLSKFNDTIFTNYLIGNWISDIQVDISGKIWVATTDSGIFVMNNNGTILSSYNRSNSGIVEDCIKSLAFDKQGNTWIGTADSGLVKLSNTNIWTRYDTSSGLANNNICDLAIDSLNNVWITTLYGGISEFNGISFINYDTLNSPILDNNISSVSIDNLGNKWFGIFDDLGILKFDGNNWINYSTSDGLLEGHVLKIYTDTIRNIIWVGSGNGVYKITCEAPIVDFISDTICYVGAGSVTHITNLSSKTEATSKYKWDIDNDGFIEFITKDVSNNFSDHGIYPVKLTVTNDNCSASITKNVLVGFKPQINIIAPDTVKICQGSSTNINTAILNYDSVFNYNYFWSTGDTNPNINVNSAGIYKVRSSIFNCYSDTDSVYLDVKQPYTGEQICVVTVDTSIDKNIIVWDKTPNKGIAFYNIYKETAVNVYQPIGNNIYTGLSVYIDANSNPKIKSDKYKISVVDTCGNESVLSSYHKTIHLDVNHDTDNTNSLIWDNYEGNNFSNYYIYRGTNTNNFQLIDSVQNNISTYIDTFPPAGKVYYYIAIDLTNICTPHAYKEIEGTYGRSLSNIDDNGLTNQQGIDKFESEYEELRIYPNPFKDKTIIEFTNKGNRPYTLTITDITGKVVKKIKDIKTGKIELNKENLSSGFYLIEVRGEKLYRGKIIVK